LPGNANPGTGFSNISFASILAARQNAWDDETPSPFFRDNIILELFINGSRVEKRAYEPNGVRVGNGESLALDTNNDGVGDGLAISESGTAINFTDPGGAAVNMVELRGTFSVDDGEVDYWLAGTLSADYDMVPEPSSAFLLGLGSLCLLARRSRITVNS